MAKYKKQPIVIEATQWFKSGDHPDDNREIFTGSDGKPFLGEGKVVRYYRTPELDGQNQCKKCDAIMHDHGWLDTGGGGQKVCPGDWIITDPDEGRYPCKPDIFAKMYELVENA